ncbi:MAG: 2-C-methyl-D-erythritol 4-phosphate cytidylyltransferase [Magnetococcales bacterium]|nr:2-C-methyl-D-erythritol 4-phosphate cytidylyltransferase [Magnetococcales bacterium]
MKTVDSPCQVLLVAAGRGCRFGSERPKQYHAVAGLPLIAHTIAGCHRHALVERIVPVVAPDGLEWWQATMADCYRQWPKLAAPVMGGAERQDSVRLGLQQLDLPDDGWVAIHDGVRPLVHHALLERLLQQRHHADALIAAWPAQDTIKQSETDSPWITATLDRRTIWQAQTPQLFRYRLILEAHKQAHVAGFSATDDASLIEWLGQPVALVTGDPFNIKVTQQQDLLLVELLLPIIQQQQTGV